MVSKKNSGMTFSQKDLRKYAADRQVYETVRKAAATANVEQAFREMCMVLDAPPGLPSFRQVVARVAAMVEVLPKLNNDAHPFSGWKEVADWFLDPGLQFDKQLEAILKHMPSRRKSLQQQSPHPLRGVAFERHPLYSAMCNQSQEHEEKYLQLQAQVLIARYRELMDVNDSVDHWIESYEYFPKDSDFAKDKARTVYHVGLALRNLSQRLYGEALEYIHPERDPSPFVLHLEQLIQGKNPVADKPLSEGAPQILRNARSFLESIQNYCSRKSAARPGMTHSAGSGYGGSPPIDGYVVYNEGRIGIVRSHFDPDDSESEETQREFITESDLHSTYTLNDGCAAGEAPSSFAAVLQSDAEGNGLPPGKQAFARSRVASLEIETLFLPWSATHLRPNEISPLVRRMMSSLRRDTSTSREARELLALIAVCMDTARPLKEAVKLKVGGINDKGELLFIPERLGRQAQWHWQAIEPSYRTSHVPQDGEVRRSSDLRFPVHWLVNSLLEAWMHPRKHAGELVFLGDSKEYEQRIGRYLRRIRSRWTLHKLSNLKRSLLVQESGGDLAAVSLILGQHHRLACVPLFYSLLSIEQATSLYERATAALWTDAIPAYPHSWHLERHV